MTTTRWLRIGLPIVLILVWLALASFGGPTFGKLSSVTSNDQASFLPASAESTTVNEWQTKFTASSRVPAVIVVESSTTLSPGQLKDVAALSTRFGSIADANSANPVVGPLPSKDGKAVQFIVPLADNDEVDSTVAKLRSTLSSELPDALTGHVAGPAGLTADLIDAFGGIDGFLLLVAAGSVFVILVLVYRSVVLPIVVLLTSVFALCGAILVVYALASGGVIALTGQSQGILSILVIGAATDYSLLIVARFRESLLDTTSPWAAIVKAWRIALEPVTASGATVILALLCLLLSDLSSNKSLGPIAAIGIVFAVAAALTLLPAMLALLGRTAFWPFRPRLQSAPATSVKATEPAGLENERGLWLRVGRLIAHRPRTTWIVALGLLVICGAGIFQLKANGVAQTDLVLTKSDAAEGQKAIGRHFDAGSGAPVVIVASHTRAADVLTAVEKTSGIGSATRLTSKDGSPVVKSDRELITATLTSQPDSVKAEQTVRDLRTTLPAVDPSALVGGTTAITIDTNSTAQRDLVTIIPVVLLVILLILMLLLRSIVAPLLLIGSVVVSFAAALGVSAVVFNDLFRFPGADPSVPLFGFVFLVALGVDYNIFLMTRVREESAISGTRPGILRGLGATGSVITSAGIVLAATFAALAVIPILFLVQIAFIVAFGVLLDTVVVRSLFVPAISYDVGRAIWWPSKLARGAR
jgi:RND superfamily putative drug exporter